MENVLFWLFALPLLMGCLSGFMLALFMEVINIFLNFPRYMWGEKTVNIFDFKK